MAGEYSPAQLQAAIDQWEKGLIQAAVDYAAALEPRMRSAAYWNDRNGPSKTGKNARQSLEAEAGLMDDRSAIQIVARSTRQTLTPWRGWDGAPVGAFLELGTRKMRRYPVIYDTLQSTAPELKTRLQSVIGDGS